VWALLPVSCATGIYLIGQLVLITYVPLYLKDVMGYTSYTASQALALTQAGAMVGRVGWGVASDRLFGGRRKIVLIVIGLLSVVLIFSFSIDADSFSRRRVARRLSRRFVRVDR
jgi:sugar phosphate permease